MKIYHTNVNKENDKKVKALKPFPGFLTVKFYRISNTAFVPRYEHPDDAGMDLFANESVVIPPHGYRQIGTGLVIILPKNTEGQIRTKSGLAWKYGLIVLNSPGTIDCNYRGELKVMLYNISNVPYQVNIGTKIAQLVVCPYHPCHIEQTFELDETDRGDGGFGSTGIKY